MDLKTIELFNRGSPNSPNQVPSCLKSIGSIISMMMLFGNILYLVDVKLHDYHHVRTSVADHHDIFNCSIYRIHLHYLSNTYLINLVSMRWGGGGSLF